MSVRLTLTYGGFKNDHHPELSQSYRTQRLEIIQLDVQSTEDL
jgi:hypothetical protein